MTIATGLTGGVILFKVESIIQVSEPPPLLLLTSEVPDKASTNSRYVKNDTSSSASNSESNETLETETFFIEDNCDNSVSPSCLNLNSQRFFKEEKTDGEVYICDIDNCGQRFTSVNYMKYHQITHGGQKSLKCEFEGCDRNFSWPAHLKYHLMTHTGSRLFKCPVNGCDKSFYTSQRLRVHKRIHTGEKPYICNEEGCDKSFTTAGNLKNHMRVHTGDRPFVCEVNGCGKRFAEQSSLKKHTFVHTGEKPYVCKVCGKTFSQSGSRNVHMKRRHHDNAIEKLSHKVFNEDILVEIDTDNIISENNQNVLILQQNEEHHLQGTVIDVQSSSETWKSNSSANVVVLAQPENLMNIAEGYHYSDATNKEIMFS